LVMIFILLFFAFNSIRHGLLIYTAIPLSAIGGIFFLAIRGMPFSISAGVGFIALFGVAVLNGIVLIAEFNRLKKEGLTDLHRIVLMGTKVRLRPVMMTAFVASLGFLPMALSQGAGAEVQRPLATVVIGGLLIATFLTLFVLPVLYIMFEKTGKVKMTPTVKLGMILLLSVFASQAFAQDTISLKSAIALALQNNLTVKNEKLRSTYHEKLSNTSGVIPQTSFTAEIGQLNSAYTDTRFGISQSISFPTVYSKQRKVNEEEWKTAVLSVSLKEEEIKRAVTHFFYAMLLLKEKEKLLLAVDSAYTAWIEKADRRYALGESNVLEKTTATIQLGEVQRQLSSLQQEMEVVRIQLQLLLNAPLPLEPYAASFKMEDAFLADSSLLLRHPQIQLAMQQKTTAAAMTGLEKAKRLPELSLSYFNTSMQGTGADDLYYSSSKRFSAAQIGVGIPIFQHAQKVKAEALQVNEVIAGNNLEQGKKELSAAYRQTHLQYLNNLQIVESYESSTLQDAKLIRVTADHQFERGEIGFLEWIMLMSQVITVRTQYLDACASLNDSIIALNYLTINQ